MTNTEHPGSQWSDSQWKNCQPGDISGLAHRLRRKHELTHRTEQSRTLSVVLTLLVLIGIGWAIFPSGPEQIEPVLTEISCEEVIKQGEKYVRHQLNPEQVLRIKNHLGKCENCQNALVKLRKKLGLETIEPNRPGKESTRFSTESPTIASIVPFIAW